MDPACHLAFRLRKNHGLLHINQKLTRLHSVVRNADTLSLYPDPDSAFRKSFDQDPQVWNAKLKKNSNLVIFSSLKIN
jgi:hypothetical protein